MTHEHDGDVPVDPAGDRVAQLVKLAGRRPMPDQARMATARDAAREEWTLLVRRRNRRTSLWTWTGAVLTACAALAAWVWLRPQAVVPGTGEAIATLRTVAGTAVFVTSGDRRAEGRTGLRLSAGDRIETPAGSGAAFTLPGGTSVRLDRSTVAVLDTATRIALDRGAVYVDSGAHARQPEVEIHTAFGVIRHLGTQFEARVQQPTLHLRVREGAVAVRTAHGVWNTRAGEALHVAHGGAPTRQTIAISGSDWAWVVPLAEPFALEGATVPAFLQWVTREQGWRWEYGDAALKDRAARIVLHGSIDGLSPEDALAAVLPTCGLTFRLKGDRLIVNAAR